jgi:ABC-2 type transport system ATP-binding protein
MTAAIPALCVQRLVKRYGDELVLDSVSLEVRAGEVTCLVGVNGSGKTTLVECVEGLRRPDGGTIEICGRRYEHGDKRPPLLGVQLQEESLPARIRVREAVEFFRRIYGAPPLAADLVALIGLDEIWEKKFVQLSGGQKRRVVVGLAIVGAPRLVILDEPTSGLDPGGQEAVVALVERLRDGGVGVLLTMHDLAQAAELGDRVVALHEGRLVAAGRPGDLVAELGVTRCISLPAGQALDVGLLQALDVTRQVVYAERRYLYGDEDMLGRLSRAGGLDALTPAGSASARVELRPVTLLDAFVAVAGVDVEPLPEAVPR